MKKVLPVVGVAGSLLLPMIAFARFESVSGFIGDIIGFVNNTLVPAIFALAFLVFLWGVFKAFILGGGDEEKRKEGKSLMMYAVVGFLLMVSLWGIVNLVATGVGLKGQQVESLPTAPQPK